MNAKIALVLGLVLAVAAISLARMEKKNRSWLVHRGEDLAQMDALVAAQTSLQTSVLEARAGIQSNFDAITHGVLAMRETGRVAAAVRTRPGANEAADALDRMTADVQADEASLETFETDLALLRSSARYFPVAADTLVRHDEGPAGKLDALKADVAHLQAAAAQKADDGTTGGATPVAWRVNKDLAAVDAARLTQATRARKVNELRADVERFENSPTREVGQRLEDSIASLTAARETFDEAARPDLDVVLGHTRAIIDRRERVDQIARGLARSPAWADAVAARAAYEHIALQKVVQSTAFRVGWIVAAGAALIMLLGALVLAGRAAPARR